MYKVGYLNFVSLLKFITSESIELVANISTYTMDCV